MAIPGDAPGHELFGIDLTALEPGASLAGPHGRRGAPLGGVADRARLGRPGTPAVAGPMPALAGGAFTAAVGVAISSPHSG
jgi:hypothetical protein